MPDTRLVWPTREIRDYLANLAIALHADNEACAGGQWGGIGHLDALVAGWDAAPADATEAVREVLLQEHAPTADNGRAWADAVLRALGMPEGDA